MNIQQRHDTVKARLESILGQARQVLQAERGDQHLSDYVTIRALARDAESCASGLLASLACNENSIASAEELAAACEESLAISPATIQSALRSSKAVDIV